MGIAYLSQNRDSCVGIADDVRGAAPMKMPHRHTLGNACREWQNGCPSIHKLRWQVNPHSAGLNGDSSSRGQAALAPNLGVGREKPADGLGEGRDGYDGVVVRVRDLDQLASRNNIPHTLGLVARQDEATVGAEQSDGRANQ